MGRETVNMTKEPIAPMTPAEADRMREIEIWVAHHETLCTARHAIIAQSIATVTSKLGKQDTLRLVGMVALGLLIVMTNGGHPKWLFDFLASVME